MTKPRATPPTLRQLPHPAAATKRDLAAEFRVYRSRGVSKDDMRRLMREEVARAFPADQRAEKEADWLDLIDRVWDGA